MKNKNKTNNRVNMILKNAEVKMSKPILFLLLIINFSTYAATATMQQEITLKPGWNAINVELEPEDNNIRTIFSGVPIASVWRWIPKNIGKDFITDPAEGLLSIDGWYGYFPEPRPEAFLSNLYTISVNTSYLVKLDDTKNHTITLTGKPTLRKNKWRSNSFTFTGFSVEKDNEPTFGDYFSGSPAHQGQAIYKLSSLGVWELVTSPFTETIKHGESYWVYTQGTSNYQGLLSVSLQQGDGLEYRTMFTELDFSISNLADVTSFVTLSRLEGNTMPMKFKNEDPETGEVAWPNLQNNIVYELLPGEDVFVTLAVDRGSFIEERMEQIFSIKNEHGVEYKLISGGNTIQPLVLPTATNFNKGIINVPESNSGLWVGNVQVRKVSEAQTAGIEPKPVGDPFILRVIMHVDANGQVRLLKSVVQMWQEGTLVPSASDPNFLEVDIPGHYVLLTDDSLIPNFSGVTLRNGQSAGIRYSTIAYDFEGNEIDMSGDLAIGNNLSVSLLIASDMPTNPFYHQYHPDHDNYDEQFINFKQEAFQVTRDMEFIFSPNNPSYPDVADPPDWGVQEMGGIFRETISGLHKNAIFMEGVFRLRRVAATTVLNQ